MVVNITVMVIKFYQKISFLLPRACRFYPTCSEYLIDSIRERGIIFGAFLALKRILKCHPFHPGGVDEVP
ncbi:MAG: membrane protein insertion efficiency factor YidD [Simkaniaceae bacterium]|nr:membrane protein insertion efficiency factor YidD [Simkaniaceae bacterium]